jgi:serine/threonine protein phosphatase PrpC
MSSKDYISSLLNKRGIIVRENQKDFFDAFVFDEQNIELVNKINEYQKTIMNKWEIQSRIDDIKRMNFPIQNGTVGKEYKSLIDFKSLGLSDLIHEEFIGLEEIGLKFNKIDDLIEGNPILNGEHKIKFLFKTIGEDETNELNVKEITLIINPDPKSLWKDIESDKSDPFWKEDNVSVNDIVGEKRIVISSKRGRSHANIGSFRDDDFAYKHFNNSGWTVVAVSDGAGSYSLSRKGSQIACDSVIEYFEKFSDIELHKTFEDKLLEFDKTRDEELLKEIQVLSKQNLYKATVFAHTKIKEFAEEAFKNNPEIFNNPKAKSPIDYFHSTLIFSLFKKFDFGYAVLTFGVGDCPIAVINKDKTMSTLMNWLDVGEFGGGTRFITQAEIFHSESNPMPTRFNFQIFPDFSYIFLMTDGIYDPKFVVEANLEKDEKWVEFLADLEGNNPEKIKVNFNYENNEIEQELSKWMDFWSTGNHDDRTLAIIF